MGDTGAKRREPSADLGAALVGLATHPRNASRELALRLAGELYGIAGSIEPLHGERNENYLIKDADGRELILKLSGAGDDLGGIDLQIAALDHIARHAPDLPVPRVIRTIDGKPCVDRDGLRIFAVSVLPGRPLKSRDDYWPLLDSLGATVARIGRALRGFHHGWRPTRLAWDPWMAPRLAPAASLIGDPALRDAVSGVFARFATEVLPRFPGYRSQFIHADGNLPNVLAVDRPAPAISGVVDFGDMIYGPLVMDLAVPCSDNIIDGNDPLATILPQVAGFTSVVPLDDDEVALLLDCMLARLAIGLAVDAWRRAFDPAGVDQIADWARKATPTIGKLLSMDRDRVVKELRRAAHRTITIPAPRPAAPAPELPELIARRHRVLGPDLSLTYKQPLHIVRGDGVWLYDATGRPFLDVYNNVPQVGHCHPRVVEAVARQAATLNTNTRYLHETVLEYSERLTATMPKGLDVCIYVNSGSEANDVAWRIATTWTGERGGIVMEHAYHGITEAIAALSPYEAAANAIAPHVRTLESPETYRGRFGRDVADAGARYAEDADRAIASLAKYGMKPALLMVDTGFTSNGVPDVPDGYFAGIAAKVRAAGGLIVADEVQFGFARPGRTFWGFQAHGVVPDIVTMGKPVGNGHPLGVVVTRREILGRFMKATDFFSTFGGNPVSATAGLAVLDVIRDEGLQENARTTGAYFRKGLEGVMARRPIIGDVRGSGLLLGVEIVADRIGKKPDRALADRVKNRMRDLGVLVGTEGINGNILKIRPPLPFRPEHADIAIAALDEAAAG